MTIFNTTLIPFFYLTLKTKIRYIYIYNLENVHHVNFVCELLKNINNIKKK